MVLPLRWLYSVQSIWNKDLEASMIFLSVDLDRFQPRKYDAFWQLKLIHIFVVTMSLCSKPNRKVEVDGDLLKITLEDCLFELSCSSQIKWAWQPDCQLNSKMQLVTCHLETSHLALFTSHLQLVNGQLQLISSQFQLVKSQLQLVSVIYK